MKERPLVYPVTVCNQPCPLLLIFSQNHIPFCSRPCRIALNRKTCAHRTVLIPFSAVLSVHSRPCAQTRTRKNGFYGSNLNECTSGGGNRNQKPRNVPRKRRSTIGFSASHKPRALQHRNGQEVLRASGRISGTVPTQSSLQRIVENFRSGGQFDRLVNQIAIIRRETGFRQAIAGNW